MTDVLIQDNRELKSEHSQLKIQLEATKQYSRKNCVEVHGISFIKNENSIELVKQAGIAIYVNESLCPARRRLYNAAREAKRMVNYKYIWIRQEKILMRKEDGSNIAIVMKFEAIKIV